MDIVYSLKNMSNLDLAQVQEYRALIDKESHKLYFQGKEYK